MIQASIFRNDKVVAHEYLERKLKQFNDKNLCPSLSCSFRVSITEDNKPVYSLHFTYSITVKGELYFGMGPTPRSACEDAHLNAFEASLSDYKEKK